jgi:hypothetical protein
MTIPRRYRAAPGMRMLETMSFDSAAGSADAPPVVEISFDRNTLVTTGRIRGTTRWPLAELARGADPQRWSLSPYFQESYKVLRGAGGYERDPAAPAPGTSWRGLLFEHFGWKLGPLAVCRFVNILNIDFQVRRERIQLDYSLHRPLSGKAWFSGTALGVDVDCGHLIAMRTPSGTSLEVTKRVRFIKLDSPAGPGPGNGPASALINRSAPVLLGHWLRQAMTPWISPPVLARSAIASR